MSGEQKIVEHQTKSEKQVDLIFFDCCAGSIQESSLHGKGMLDFSVGKEPLQLDPAIFSNLRVLWMKSDMQIKICIPSTVCLTSLEAYVDTLSLRFWDADATCKDLTTLHILHRSRGPAKGQIGTLELEEALKNRGISLCRAHMKDMSTGCQEIGAQEGYNGGLSYIGLPSEDTFGYHYSVFHGAQERCRCTMCWSCQNFGSLSRE